MWTPDALASEAKPYDNDIWRVVENQAKASTMRIVDTAEEQRILEEVLESSKPSMPPECAGLNFLLATPFRYSPYPNGSRFRRAGQPEGAFYAAEKVETAVAELAFYRLLFFAESPQARLPRRSVEHTAFSARCRATAMIDLTMPPLDRDQAAWTDPTDYGGCQSLADAAREAAIQAIRYQSVRDPGRGVNVALLSPGAFGTGNPISRQTWHVFPRDRRVQAWCESPFHQLEFTLADFGADPRIAATQAG